MSSDNLGLTTTNLRCVGTGGKRSVGRMLAPKTLLASKNQDNSRLTIILLIAN